MAPSTNDAEAHPTFTPLDKTRQEIRLLSFRTPESSAPDKLRCELSVFDLATCPPFIALSYVWGLPSDDERILMNGSLFSKHTNVYAALQSIGNHVQCAHRRVSCSCSCSAKDRAGAAAASHISTQCHRHGGKKAGKKLKLRDCPEDWTHFWIDAICIDQHSISERNHQVRMMGSIYKTAAFVLVWLGDDVDCAAALSFLRTAEGDTLRGVYTVTDDDAELTTSNNDSLGSLYPLLNAQYWTRMWIVQEFVLARNIVLAAGGEFLPWEYAEPLFGCPEYPGQTCLNFTTAEMDAPTAAWRIAQTRRARQCQLRQGAGTHQLWRLDRLMVSFQRHQCSDVRDRLFALCGLVDLAEGGDRLVPDYSLTPEELCISLVDMFRHAARDELEMSHLGWVLTHILEIREGRFRVIEAFKKAGLMSLAPRFGFVRVGLEDAAVRLPKALQDLFHTRALGDSYTLKALDLSCYKG